MGVIVTSDQITPAVIAGAASLILSDGDRERELVGTLALHGIYVLPGLKIPTSVKEKTWAESTQTEGRRPTSSRAKNPEGGLIPLRIVAPSAAEIIHHDPEEIDALYGDADGTIAERFAYLLDDLQELVESADGATADENATLRYTPPDGVEVTYRLASIHLADWPQDRQLAHYRAEAAIEFECMPWGELASETLVTAASLIGPIDDVEIPDVRGHVDALMVATFRDLSSIHRDDVEVAIQEDFDPANPEPLRLQAADLETLQGTLVGENIEGVTVAQWTALASTGELPHKGRWQIYARIEAEANANSTIDSSIRFSYRSGSGRLQQTGRPAVTPHLAGELIDVDLGVVNIREGTPPHAFSGQVEIRGETTGLDFKLRELHLVPAGRKARLRAPQRAPAITGIVGYDSLGSVDGALDAETAPLGGDWDRVAGDLDDFQGDDGYIVRAATNDDPVGTSGLLGVFARLGTGVAATTDVRVEVNPPMPATTTWSLYGGVFARYVDENNWLLALRNSARHSLVQASTQIFLYKCVAGTLTAISGSSRSFVAAWHTLVLLALPNGAVLVFMGPAGAQDDQLDWVAGSAPDPDLATGGALAQGGWGIACGPVPAAEPQLGVVFRNFIVGEGESADHAVHPDQSLRLARRSAERESADGSGWGRVPHYRGKRLYLPPSTRAGRSSRLVVRQDPNDLRQQPVADAGHELVLALEATPRVVLTGR